MKEITKIAEEICGKKRKKNQIWMNDEVLNLVKNKEMLFCKWQSKENQGPKCTDSTYLEYRDANKACIKATKKAKIKQVLDG